MQPTIPAEKGRLGGGRKLSVGAQREVMWADYPQALHTEEMKSYYLVQLSFWTHMIFVTCIEVHRSDFAMMILHHCITSWLVATSCKRRLISPRRFLHVKSPTRSCWGQT